MLINFILYLLTFNEAYFIQFFRNGILQCNTNVITVINIFQYQFKLVKIKCLCQRSIEFTNKSLSDEPWLVFEPSKQNFIILSPLSEEWCFFPVWRHETGSTSMITSPPFPFLTQSDPWDEFRFQWEKESQMPPGLWPSPDAYRSRPTFFVDMSATELWKWQHKQGRWWHVFLPGISAPMSGF